MASSRRERELARMRAERQAARRAAAAARRRQRNAVIASVVAVALVAGGAIALAASLSHNSSSQSLAKAAASASPSASASASSSSASASPSPAPGTCVYTRSAEPAARKAPLPPSTGVQTTGASVATLKTNRGVLHVSLDHAKAACTTNSFRSLAAAKYFTNTPCHRLTTAGIFVLQCGDPTGKGTGGPGYTFADENLSGAHYPRGTVAMANSGAGTNGSQFFLVYKDTQLPPSYTPFGTITSGLDVLEKIAAGGSEPSGDGKPKLPTFLQSVTVS